MRSSVTISCGGCYHHSIGQSFSTHRHLLLLGDLHKLSDKDKTAQRVLETANMVLKMSQMNRQGGKIHIGGMDHKNTPLPPILGGESFAKAIRQHSYRLGFCYLIIVSSAVRLSLMYYLYYNTSLMFC